VVQLSLSRVGKCVVTILGVLFADFLAARVFLPDANSIDGSMEVLPSIVELGTMRQGIRREFTFTIHNQSDRTVAVDRLDFSCDCLSSNGFECVLAPSELRTIRMALDLSRKPEFTGQLLLNITGRSAGDNVVFLCRVRVHVKD
jgi:hypothetical protein